MNTVHVWQDMMCMFPVLATAGIGGCLKQRSNLVRYSASLFGIFVLYIFCVCGLLHDVCMIQRAAFGASFCFHVPLPVRRIISMEALTQSQEQKSNVDGSVPYPDPTGSMSNMTPRLQPGNSAPSNLRMRWSFSDAKVTPSLPVHLVAPGVPRQVASPQNVVMSSSWTPPGVQPAWRSPRHSYTPTSACSTPQAPPVLMKPGNEMRTSLKGSGTATPPAPNFNRPLGTHGGCGSYAPLAAFPRQPNVRSTVGVAQGLSRPNLAQAKALAVPGAPAAPPAAAPAPVPQTVPCGFVQVTGPPAPHPATSPTARAPAAPVAPVAAAVGPVAPPASATPDAKRAPAEAPHPSLPVQPLYQPLGQDATATRQSLGRRMWRSGTHGKAIGPPSHHEKDDNLTSVCVKLQHKLGKLSTKKTISLWRNVVNLNETNPAR